MKHVETWLMQLDEVRDMPAYIRQYQSTDAPFEVVIAGSTANQKPANAARLLKRYAEAGVMWWQEGFMWNDTINDVRKRIHQGLIFIRRHQFKKMIQIALKTA